MSNYKNLLDPIEAESVVEVVINRITNSIITGELKNGDRIPTEKEFSENLRVGRNSVREAIKVLVYLGVLEIRRPGGTFVKDGPSDKMLNPLLYSLILEGGDSDVVEMRHLIEVGISNLAIKKATDEDIENIRIACDHFVSILKNENAGYEMISQADILFHNAVEQATHNSLIKRLNTVITMLTLPSRIKTIEKVVTMGEKQFLIDSHIKIFEMIKNRDSSQVIEVMEYSYFYWKDNV